MAWNDSGWFPDEQLKIKSWTEALDKINQMFKFLDGKFRNILSFQLDGGSSLSDWEIGSQIDGGSAIDY